MSPTRALYSQVNPAFWLPTARLLQQEDGWEPVWWLGPESRDSSQWNAVRAAFPSLPMHSRYDAVHNRWPSDAHVPQVALDGWWLDRLAGGERLALRMMDRMDPDGRSFSHDERLRHFHRLVRRWLGLVEDLQPEVVVFQEIPGFVSEFALWEVARNLGIPQVFFNRTWSGKRVYATSDFRQPIPGIRDALDKALAAGEPVLSDEARHHLGQMRSEPEVVRAEIARNFTAPLRERALDLRRVARQVRRAARGEALAPTWDKQPGREVEDSRPSAAQVARTSRGEAQRRSRLRATWESLATPGLPGGDYVYIPLHYQPEVTTSPMGGAFVDQEHVVRLVADCLPDGWHAVVKEHPATFRDDFQGNRGRNVRFYRDLAEVPRVTLASIDAPSLELIDGARAVATVTGTAGWEALLRGTPPLAFGAAWYADCPGVHSVGDRASVRGALGAVASGTSPDPAAVEAFIAATEVACLHVHANDAYISEPAGPDHAQSMARAIRRVVALADS